jgi:hypothetical protein
LCSEVTWKNLFRQQSGQYTSQIPFTLTAKWAALLPGGQRLSRLSLAEQARAGRPDHPPAARQRRPQTSMQLWTLGPSMTAAHNQLALFLPAKWQGPALPGPASTRVRGQSPHRPGGPGGTAAHQQNPLLSARPLSRSRPAESPSSPSSDPPANPPPLSKRP